MKAPKSKPSPSDSQFLRITNEKKPGSLCHHSALKNSLLPLVPPELPPECGAFPLEPMKGQHRLPRYPFRRGQVWQLQHQSSGHYNVIPLV